MTVLEKVREKANELYAKDDFMHGLIHIQAVVKNALTLQSRLGGDAEVIEIAALLHDCDYSRGIAFHHEDSAVKAKQILTEFNYDKTNQVVAVILNHKSGASTQNASLEAKILFDADKIESLKPSGIVRVVKYHHDKSYPEIVAACKRYSVDLINELNFEETKQLIHDENELTKRFVEAL